MMKKFIVMPGILTSALCFAVFSNTAVDKGISGFSNGEISIQGDIFIFEDKSGSLSFEDISKPDVKKEFKPNTSRSYGRGYSDSAFWIYYKGAFPETLNEQERFLVLGYPHLDKIEFYHKNRNTDWTVSFSGDSRPFAERGVLSRFFIFRLEPPAVDFEFFLRLKSNGAVTFPLSIEESGFLSGRLQNDSFFYGVYFGFILIMVIYNLFFLLLLRERIYLFYSFHVFFILLYEITSNGFAFRYLWPLYPQANNYMDNTFISLTFFSLCLFAADFLKSYRNFPLLHKVLMAFGTAALLFIPVYILCHRKIGFYLSQALALSVILLVMILVYRAFRIGMREARFFIYGWSAAIAGVVYIVFTKINILPVFPVNNLIIPAGVIFVIIVLSMGLADRINIMKKQLADSESKLLKANDELFERNSELTAANEEFEAQNEELIKACYEIEESEKRFRGLSDLLPQMIFELNPGAEVTYINKQGLELTGLSEEDIDGGVNFISLFNDTDRVKAKTYLDSVFSGAEAVGAEFSIINRNREEVPVLLIGRKIKGSENSGGIIGSVIDLTERKKAERIMVQNEKMSTVASLAAGMAHEINNPLTIILMAVQNIKRRISADSKRNSEVCESHGLDLNRVNDFLNARSVNLYLDSINDAGIRAASIISDMLNFSRHSGRKKEKISINGIIDQAINLAGKDFDIKSDYDFRRIRIVRNYGELPAVPVIKTQIEQVIFNLLRNAAQSIVGNKQQETPAEINITTRFENGDAVIVIQDNGPGIENGLNERIFEPFFTTKAPGEGTGLGLSVAYYIIARNHNGTIKAETANGAVFTITLPAEEK